MRPVYMMGSFYKKQKAMFHIDNIKPFEIDTVRGTVSPKVMRFFGRPAVTFNEWQYLEGYTLTDIEKNTNNIQEFCEDLWKEWCYKHKRKYTKIFKGEKDND